MKKQRTYLEPQLFGAFVGFGLSGMVMAWDDVIPATSWWIAFVLLGIAWFIALGASDDSD